MRSLSSSALAALAANRVVTVVLVEMQLSLPVYLCSAAFNIDWNGVTWVGAADLGAVSTVSDSVGELQPLHFSLLAADTAIVAVALGEPTQGKAVIVRSMLLSEAGAVIDVQTVWSGTLEPMGYEEQFNDDGTSTPVVSVQAEHRGVAMQRPNPARYTDADQQREFPGDLSLEYIVAQAAHQDVWPAAAFFRQ